ncbi:ABC transporter permease [Peredibacter sp. HCB2-198]|uniref:ABC transporter permease n=1 Tax=Peredibacter sp. HCB2-198 TaxID=3383025 RepID=UPI0038B5A650
MIWTLWKKELESYFASPLAYVLVGLFSLISGIIFFNLLATYTDGIQAIPQNMAQEISFVEEVVLRLFANINFLFLVFIPLITMRLFSEEKRLETIDLYWLAPVREWQVVLSKGLAAFTLIITMLVMTGIFPLIIWGVGIRDFSLLTTAYLGVACNALCYISLGLFCSSLSGNQIIAALLSVLGIMFLWMITWGGHLNSNYLVAEIFTYIGITSHFERILRGLIGTQDIIYYLTFIFLFGFLTVKSLGRRNW